MASGGQRGGQWRSALQLTGTSVDSSMLKGVCQSLRVGGKYKVYETWRVGISKIFL